MADNGSLANDVQSTLQVINDRLYALDKVKAIYEPQIAPRFSSFNFKWMNWITHTENALSDQLAYFLNPEEGHAQGSTFLDIFLSRCAQWANSSPERFELLDTSKNNVEVRTEKYAKKDENAKRRFIDIVIDFKKESFSIGIENKLGAEDGDKQLKDYNDYLRDNSKDYLLIYLTFDGTEPDEKSLTKDEAEKLKEAGNYCTISHHSETEGLLESWAQASVADKVRHYLFDLKQYLHQTLLGEIPMDRQQEILNVLKEDSSKIATAYEMGSMQIKILELVAPYFKQACEELAEEEDFISSPPDFNGHINDRWFGFQLRIKDWNLNRMLFEFHNEKLKTFQYGVAEIATIGPYKHTYSAEYVEQLKHATQIFHGHEFTPVVNDYPELDWNTPKKVRQILEKEPIKEELRAVIREIHQNVEIYKKKNPGFVI